MESRVKRKIQEYLHAKKMSKYRFYKKTGITRGILDFDTGMTEHNIILFIEHCNINPLWLFLDIGEMDLINHQNLSADQFIDILLSRMDTNKCSKPISIEPTSENDCNRKR